MIFLYRKIVSCYYLLHNLLFKISKKVLIVKMKKKKLWILFIITTSVYAYLMLVTVPALKAMAGGMDILDVPPFYDVSYIQELFRRLGEEGRHFYLYRQIPVDMIYPGLFAITYYQLIRFFLEKLNQKKLLFLSYFPIIGGIFDYFENLSTITMLTHYPENLWIETLAPYFSLMKCIFVVFSWVLFFVLGITTFIKTRKQ